MMFSYNLLMSSLIRRLYSFPIKFSEELKAKRKKEKKKESSGDDYDTAIQNNFDNIDDQVTRK